jgi:hypothetical protein
MCAGATQKLQYANKLFLMDIIKLLQPHPGVRDASVSAILRQCLQGSKSPRILSHWRHTST